MKDYVTWKRAGNATIVAVMAVIWMLASGCVGVRDQLFQPLPPPSATLIGNAPRGLERAPTAAEPLDREDRLPWPDTRLEVEPPEDTEDLLRDLDEVEPEPEPLKPDEVTPAVDWRG